MGFGRACAPVRCAHPSFWSHDNAQQGAARSPPIAASLLLFLPQSFPSGPNSAARGVYLSIGLSCTLLSHIASYWATLHPPELRCTLLSSTAPWWATLHPIEVRCTSKICCIQLSYAAISELSWALLSYTAPLWATLPPTELCLTLNELCGTLKIYVVPRTSQLCWSLQQNNGI